MQQVLKDCEGAQDLYDDIVLYGLKQEEHDARREGVL